ncbi:hypothetical protein AB0A69_28265 [Streptomyces sp. NPDC045431]|uniref:hypothetical protein n=1 Tax=Streptomyces sp. NPDC045431 TaxID=3155613 RepID=UPI003402F92D
MNDPAKEAEVRRMLQAPPRPRVPADLAARAIERGARSLRRARLLRRTAWLLLCAALTALTVWASTLEP